MSDQPEKNLAVPWRPRRPIRSDAPASAEPRQKSGIAIKIPVPKKRYMQKAESIRQSPRAIATRLTDLEDLSDISLGPNVCVMGASLRASLLTLLLGF